MRFVTSCVAFVVVLMILVLAAIGSGKPATRPPILAHTPVLPAVSFPVGAVASSVGFVAVEFSEPSWVMPDLRGWRLNAAKREVLRLTQGNVSSLKSHDASGTGRAQFWDPNWKVCSQNVPPGARITTTTTVDFGVVKIREHC